MANEQSNVERILRATIDGTTYEIPATSRVEDLLLELKEAIEAGGGGGGAGDVTKAYVDARDETKVDKVEGKGLSTEDYTTAEKTKLAGIAAGAEVNVQPDWSQSDDTADNYIKNKPTLGTAAAKDSTNTVTANSTDLVESGAVKTAIDTAISSAYHPSGDITCAELTSSLLVAENEGNIYNVTDSGITTADFKGGANKPIHVGDEVAIVRAGNGYMFNLMAGFIDLQNYVQKSSTSGLLKNDGTVDNTEYATQADVSNAGGFTKSVEGTAISIADSVETYLHGLTIKGHSTRENNAVSSVGDNGLTVTLSKTGETSRTLSVASGLPLYGMTGSVDLGSLNWHYQTDAPNPTGTFARFHCDSVLRGLYVPTSDGKQTDAYIEKTASCSSVYTANGASAGGGGATVDKTFAISKSGVLYVVDNDYTDVETFKAAVSGIILTYPSFFDEIDFTAGTITKYYAKVKVRDLSWWNSSDANRFGANLSRSFPQNGRNYGLSDKYPVYMGNAGNEMPDKSFNLTRYDSSSIIYVQDSDYSSASSFKSANLDVIFIYPLATPIVTQLTAAEIAAYKALKTFEGTTDISATDSPEMTVKYVCNSDDGEVIADLQEQIDDIPAPDMSNYYTKTETDTAISTAVSGKQNAITQSATLTLTVAGWDSQTKQQTIAFAHDTAKRNEIDVTVSELKTWADCGVIPVSETAAGITFECETIPEDALTFKVVSMEVS